MIILKNDETLEDLQYKGLRMIQKKEGFRFGEDSVLLANYVANYYNKTKNTNKSIIDLGCNSGSISLLLAKKLPKSKITGVEITKSAFDAFLRNIKLNSLENEITPINENWENLSKVLPYGQVDCVVSNPPYKKNNSKSGKIITDLLVAQEEIHSNLGQMLKAVRYVLKPKGLVFLIYKIERLPEVISEMKLNKIEPRRIKLIQPFIERQATTFIIVGQKDGKQGSFNMEVPFVVFDKQGQYTSLIQELYGKDLPLSKEELYNDIQLL